jgi:hypothetical protein
LKARKALNFRWTYRHFARRRHLGWLVEPWQAREPASA